MPWGCWQSWDSTVLSTQVIYFKLFKSTFVYFFYCFVCLQNVQAEFEERALYLTERRGVFESMYRREHMEQSSRMHRVGISLMTQINCYYRVRTLNLSYCPDKCFLYKGLVEMLNSIFYNIYPFVFTIIYDNQNKKRFKKKFVLWLTNWPSTGFVYQGKGWNELTANIQ